MKIADLEFKTKKDALSFFKTILNSYKFGEELSPKDFLYVLGLLKMHPKSKTKIGIGIKNIRITKIPKYNTKAFELIRLDDSTEIFSYINCLNVPKTDAKRFTSACRQAVQGDLRNVKLAYFQQCSKKGKVKCQETNELLVWADVHIDHRQPNTFSVIVDRFIELYNIDIHNVKYIEVLDGVSEFEDEKLNQKFREYHKEKANLRVVKKNLNLGRSYQARINTQKKDLKIE
jgi:hypothetical protein